MEITVTVQEVYDRGCWEAVCKTQVWTATPFNEWRFGPDQPITLSEAEARECGLIGPPPYAPPPEVTIEQVRAAGRSPGIEPDWKEAYEELYRSFQQHLKRQEAFVEILLECARVEGALTMAIAKGRTNDPPAGP